MTTPGDLRWVLDHNPQIRGGHRVVIHDAIEAWRAAEDTLRVLVAEMRALARVAGQASVEGPADEAARMAEQTADRATRWADTIESVVGRDPR